MTTVWDICYSLFLIVLYKLGDEDMIKSQQKETSVEKSQKQMHQLQSVNDVELNREYGGVPIIIFSTQTISSPPIKKTKDENERSESKLKCGSI